MTVINAKVGSAKYPVLVSETALVDLFDFCSGFPDNNVVCIVDDFFQCNSNESYPEINHILAKYKCLYILGGVESKSLTVYSLVVTWLLENKLPRDGIIIAIGGGVVGDLAAFVASTYMRGVGFALVPTTTTSMIDSAIGGKTGLNFLDQVNAIGSYYNPLAVFMDVRFMLTLEHRDYVAGICEAIKMSITSDATQARNLFDNSALFMSDSKDISSYLDLIVWSTKIKLFHVGDDPSEKGIRLTLNYGHTFGQSIETYYGLYQDHYRHGEAVALGMMCAAHAIHLLDSTNQTDELLYFTKHILSKYCLPTSLEVQSGFDLPNVKILVDNLVNDKKRLSQGNRFVLVPSLGSSFVQIIDNTDILQTCFQAILS